MAYKFKTLLKVAEESEKILLISTLIFGEGTSIYFLQEDIFKPMNTKSIKPAVVKFLLNFFMFVTDYNDALNPKVTTLKGGVDRPVSGS
ncbi:hypothetical protein D3C85_1129050 [compost metagenome]